MKDRMGAQGNAPGLRGARNEHEVSELSLLTAADHVV
jgi:hypothetical protein